MTTQQQLIEKKLTELKQLTKKLHEVKKEIKLMAKKNSVVISFRVPEEFAKEIKEKIKILIHTITNN